MFRFLVFLSAFLASIAARAGAFLQPAGQGEIIAELGFSEAGRAYDALGRGGAIPAWRKFELSTYAEYGLADWITLIGDPSWFTFRAKPPGRSHSGLGATEAGARVKIAGWDANMLSAQATVRYAAGGRGARDFSDMGRRTQADVRILYGRAIEMLGMTGYIDTQIGFRTRGAFGNQVRFDATWALRPFEKITVMLQSFTAITPGRLGDKFALSQKAQLSGVYDVTSALSLQLGVMIALRGVNSPAERGVVSAMWWRF